MHPVVGLVLAYLLGAIPAAYIAGKATRGIDLRQHGSGNLGATNVYRVLGGKVAGAVLAFDIAKGAVPAALLPRYTGVPPSGWWAIGFGIAAILGHFRSPFLRYKGGGKGVATAAGVFLALAPTAMGIAVLVWLAVVLLSGYVSLASLAASATLPASIYYFDRATTPRFIVSVVVAVFVFWTHRSNITRLRRGEEHRFGRKSKR